ncbi:MAG: ATPase V [Bacteroidales bacterium]|nr:ATPase V [Bacteroidales bacterium]
MIAPMTKYAFILLQGDEGRFLERLQELGVVDITRSIKPVDEHSAACLNESDALRRTIAKLEQVRYEGIQPAAVDSDKPVEDVRAAFEQLESLQGTLDHLYKEAEARRPWGEFSPARLKDLAEAGLTVRFYRTPLKRFDAGWAAEYPLQVVAQDSKTVWFVTISDDPAYSFPIAEIPAPKGTAAEALGEAEALAGQIDQVKARLLGLQKYLPQLREDLSGKMAQLDLYFAGKAAGSTAEGHIVTFTGFVPEDQADEAERRFADWQLFYLRENAVVEDNPPIQLKNNRFVRMFEVLTDMYGRPAYDGFDPTPFISVFFLLFFAFCMGDCGYGLILILIGLLLKKVDSFKDLSPLVVTLGVGTAVIGFFFHTFFSMDISQWAVFAPIKGIFLPGKIMGYDGTMVLSIIVGVVHICLAMCVKTYEETKNKGFVNSLGTWGWTLLIVGGVAVGALALIGVLDAALTKWIVIVLGVVSALGIFLLNDMHRSKLANIGVGLWDTYNTATGLVGDVLSYLRLYALGLAGSMLGLAFNNIGTMVLGDGSNVFLWIPFLLIVIVGHTLNIAMAALGAFVHPLRLNFLEFFKNSGYEGVGRHYNPLKK